jgi:ribosomal protein S27AE
MKTCTKCKEEKEIKCFSANNKSKDGRAWWCKKCVNDHTTLRYQANRTARKEYEKMRDKQPHRKKLVLEKNKRQAKKHREKFRARDKTYKAIKSGALVRQPCQACGDPKVEAHHDDYSKPLDVRWLCHKHHREVHGQRAIEDDVPTTPTLTEKPL